MTPFFTPDIIPFSHFAGINNISVIVIYKITANISIVDLIIVVVNWYTFDVESIKQICNTIIKLMTITMTSNK